MIIRRTVMHDKKVGFGYEFGLFHHAEFPNISLFYIDAKFCDCPPNAVGEITPISNISAGTAANIEENVECTVRSGNDAPVQPMIEHEGGMHADAVFPWHVLALAIPRCG